MKDKENTKSRVLDILNKFSFILGQRAGRELWLDKPEKVQDEDLYNFNEDIKYIKNYIENDNRQVWHKVADGDYPKRKSKTVHTDTVQAYYIDSFGKKITEPLYFYFIDKSFRRISDCAPLNVIAWTELPEYKE